MSISFDVSATVQTQFQHSAGQAVGTLKSSGRTFSLSGVMGTGIVRGDQVAIWGSNDGGSTYQPLRLANNQPVQLTFSNPEVVIDDSSTHYAMQRQAVGSGSTLAAVGLSGEDTGINASPPWVQGGNAFGATGVLGTTDAFPLHIIAESNTVFSSDGSAVAIGGTGGVAIAGGAGGVMLGASGAGGISFSPGTTGGVVIQPRAAGAGNTSTLALLELAANGTNFVGFKAPDAIASDVTWVLPNADANLANKALLSDGAGNLSWGNAIQSGAANLTNGVSAAIPANISATSRIFIQAQETVPGAGNLTIDYRPLAADRINGTPGSFKITAVIAAGTINALDQSQGIMWMVLNA